jgi:transcriptional regulator with XRE-family HTH domain
VEVSQAQQFGDRIRRARLRRGLTLDQLAGLADLHHAYLIRIEKGRANPSIGAVVRIYEALGYSAERVFLPPQPPPPTKPG